MNKKITIPDEVIINKIYVIRGQKVMLDREGAAKEFKDMFLESIPPEFLKEEVDRKIQNKITYDMEKLGQKHHRKLIHLSEQQGKLYTK